MDVTVFGMPLVRQQGRRGQRGAPVSILGLSPVQPSGSGLPSLAHLYSGVRVRGRGAGWMYRVPRARGSLAGLYRVPQLPRPSAERGAAGRRGRKRGVGAGVGRAAREPAFAKTRMADLRRAMLKMRRFAIADLVRVGRALGLSESAVRSYVSKLEARGLVRRLGRGVYELTEEGAAYIAAVHGGAPSAEEAFAAAGRDIIRAGVAVKRWLAERLRRRKAVKVPVEEAGGEEEAGESGEGGGEGGGA